MTHSTTPGRAPDAINGIEALTDKGTEVLVTGG